MKGINLKVRKFGLGIATLIGLIILLDYHFFYFISFSGILNVFFNERVYMTVAFFAVLLYVYILYSYRMTMQPYKKWMLLYGGSILFIFIIMFFFCVDKYPLQKTADTINTGGKYLYPLLAVPFLFLFERDYGPKHLLKILNIFVLLWYILSLVQDFIYDKTGSFLFEFMDYFYGNVRIRNSSVRIGPGTFGNIMLLYNFNILLFGKNISEKRFSLVMVVLGLYHLFVIQQTRMSILACSIGIATLILFYGNNKKQQITRFLLIIALGIGLSCTNYVQDFISTFTSTSIEYEGSSIARDYAVTYFLSVLSENPIFGYGWPFDASYSNIAHGALGTAYTNDVGFLGLLVELGIFAIPLYVIPCIRMGFILRNTRYEKRNEFRMFLVVVLVFMAVTSITIIITDGGRCLAFPLVIALFEYYYAGHNELEELYEDIDY